MLAGLPAKAREPVREMVQAIELCASEAANLTIADIYDTLLARTGYMKAVSYTHLDVYKRQDSREELK